MSTDLSTEAATELMKQALDIPQVTAKGRRSITAIIEDVAKDMEMKTEASAK